MNFVVEIAALMQGAGRLWLRKLPELGTWFCLAWAGREAGLMAAVLFGANLVPAMICFVASMLVWVICLVMMLHSLTGGLISFRQAAADPSVPPIRPMSRREVLLEAVIPFLAVYAVWGLTEDQVQRAFGANMAFYNMDTASFSITFAAWQLYLAIAVGVWVAQGVAGLWLRGRGGLPAALLMTALRGTAILTAFIGLDTAATRAYNWLLGRQVWEWGRQLWQGFLDALPNWRLPMDLTLPEAISKAASGFWGYVVPGFFEAVLIPLIWLALTAMLVGWRDFTHGVANGRLASALTTQAQRVRNTKLGGGLSRATASSPLGLIRYGVQQQLEDLLPAVQALRLLLRSGLGFLGAYLVVGAAARGLEGWLYSAVMWSMGPINYAVTLGYLWLVELFAMFFAWTLAACVYLTAFDRAMLGAVAHAKSLDAQPVPIA